MMSSDGIQTRWSLADLSCGILTRDPILIAAAIYRDFVRGTDDATVLVARRDTLKAIFKLLFPSPART